MAKLGTRQLREAQSISEAIFNAKHRLPMAVVIARADADDLYAKRLAPWAGTTEVQAGAELRHFAQAGLLDVLPPPERTSGQRGRPPKRYARRDSVFWDLAPQLATERRPRRRNPV
jgi:hypothetical protein